MQESPSLHNQGWADLETLAQDRASCAGPSSNRRGMPLGTSRKDRKGGGGGVSAASADVDVCAGLPQRMPWTITSPSVFLGLLTGRPTRLTSITLSR